jgi:hypothetical protein
MYFIVRVFTITIFGYSFFNPILDENGKNKRFYAKTDFV